MNKLILLITSSLLISISIIAQIPNGAFELWTNGLPDSWTTNSFPPNLMPVSPSNDAHSGTYALKGEVVNYNGGFVPPNITNTSSNGLGFPINKRYVDLTGWYKSNLVGFDVNTISIVIYHSSLSIGYGFAYLPAAQDYSKFTIPISYTAMGGATTAFITIAMADSSGSGFNVGSQIIIDDLELETVTDINQIDVSAFAISPNPAVNQLNIAGNFKAGQFYEQRLFNSNGKMILKSNVIASLTSLPPIDIANIPEGIYFLYVSDSKNTSVKKVLISR